jgi:hypothetical protein
MFEKKKATGSAPAMFKARIWAESKREPEMWNITAWDTNSLQKKTLTQSNTAFPFSSFRVPQARVY